MRKIYLAIIALLTIEMCYGQTVTTTRTGGWFHSKCTDGFQTQNRSVFRLASNDGENHVIQNRGVECTVISPDHTIKGSGFDDNNASPVNSIDTTFYSWQMSKIYEKNSNARHFLILYKKDSLKLANSYLMIKAKDSLPKPLDCDECGQRPLKIKFKAKIIDDYIFDATEIEHQYISITDPEPDFKIDTTFANIIESNRFKFQFLSTKQNQIIKFDLILQNGSIVDYPQDDKFNASNLGNNTFRHGRYIENLQPDTNYKFQITCKSELGTIRKTKIISFKTLN